MLRKINKLLNWDIYFRHKYHIHTASFKITNLHKLILIIYLFGTITLCSKQNKINIITDKKWIVTKLYLNLGWINSNKYFRSFKRKINYSRTLIGLKNDHKTIYQITHVWNIKKKSSLITNYVYDTSI